MTERSEQSGQHTHKETAACGRCGAGQPEGSTREESGAKGPERSGAGQPEGSAREERDAKGPEERGAERPEGSGAERPEGPEESGLQTDGGGEGCACHRTKEREEREYKDLIHRLNRIEGQVRGIRGMVEKNAYCPEILTQVAAVTAALGSFNKVLLANHIRTCVTRDIREGRDGTVDELVNTLQKLMR